MLETEIIDVPVPVSLAKEYKKLSGQEKKQMEMSIYLALQDIYDDPRSLGEISKEATETAKKNGFTNEVLQEILDEK